MAIGLFMLAMGYLWIAYGVKDVPPGIKVSMIWLTGHVCPSYLRGTLSVPDWLVPG